MELRLSSYSFSLMGNITTLSLSMPTGIACGAGALKAAATRCKAQLEDVVWLLQSSLTHQQRLTLGAAVVMDVHRRDVTVSLAEQNIITTTDFAWQSQLRAYWEVRQA